MTTNGWKLRKLQQQIRQKRCRAKHDGIEIITADELTTLALSYPDHVWQNIGSRKSNYCFARKDHSTGYTIDNTTLDTVENNTDEMLERYGKPRLNISDDERRKRKLQQYKAWRDKKENRHKKWRIKNPKKAAARLKASRLKRKERRTR
jgi:hypothetical protein